MHYHVEIHIPNNTEIEKQIAEILQPYEDHYDDESNPRPNLWDWYVIGGRWTGAHDGHDPRTDPRNYERCWLCNGTGFRCDALGMKARQDDPTYTCNGCGHFNEAANKWEHGPAGPGMKLKGNLVPHYEDVMELGNVSDKLTAAYLIAGGVLRESTHKFGEDGLNVKQELTQLGITSGYLVTVDIHD